MKYLAVQHKIFYYMMEVTIDTGSISLLEVTRDLTCIGIQNILLLEITRDITSKLTRDSTL